MGRKSFSTAPGRISDFLDREVLPRLRPEDVYDHPRHEFSDGGAELRGGCPFHDSHSGQSFCVQRQNLSWYCFGCGVGGGPIQYLARLAGITEKVRGSHFLRLARDLARRAGVPFPEKDFSEADTDHMKRAEERRQALQVVQAVSHRRLLSPAGAAAREYLQNRGVTEEAVRELGLGLCGPSDATRRALEAAGVDPKVAQEAGVLNPRLENYLSVPWCDHRGALLTFGFRYAAPQPPEGHAKARGLPGEGTKATPLFLDRVLRAGRRAVTVVEGLFDAIVAQVLGDATAVACVGSQVTQAQAMTLSRCGIAKATLSLDPDSAGDSGTRRSIQVLQECRIDVYVAERLPEAMDPDEYILAHGIEAWTQRAAQAIPGDDYILQTDLNEIRGEGWTEDKRLQFLDAAAQSKLEPRAARMLVEDLLKQTEDGEQAVAATLDSKALIRAFGRIWTHDRAGFEATMEKLRSIGALHRRVTALNSAVTSHAKTMAKEEAERDQLRSHEFETLDPRIGAPVAPGLLVPPGYQISERGIVRESTDAKGHSYKTRICPSPILLAGRLREVEEGTEHVQIVYPRDGVWKRTVVSRRTISDAREILMLSNVGVPVSSNTSRDIVDYFTAFEQVNLGVLPYLRMTRHLGYQDGLEKPCFLWGRTLVHAEGEVSVAEDLGDLREFARSPYAIYFCPEDPGSSALASGYRREGSFDRWKETVRPLLRYFRLVIPLLTSLSTPLLRILRAGNPIVSMSGFTSRGKTTSLRVAASAWGHSNPAEPSSIVRIWDCTMVFVERLGSVLHSLPLFMDDTSLAQGNGRIVAHIIYQVASGQGRGRGSVIGVRRTSQWMTALISTGEQPLASFQEGVGGTHARVLEYWGSPLGDGNQSELARSIVTSMDEDYGHAGPAFLQFILKNQEEWPEWRRLYQDRLKELERELSGNAVACRLAGLLGVLDTTARLACTERAAVLPWSYDEVQPALQAALEQIRGSAEEADRAREALRLLHSWAVRHRDQFWSDPKDSEGTKLEPPQGYAGRWDHDDGAPLCFSPDLLKRLLENWNFPHQATLRLWKDRSWLVVSESGRHTVRTQLGEKRTRLVQLRADILDEVCCGEEESGPTGPISEKVGHHNSSEENDLGLSGPVGPRVPPPEGCSREGDFCDPPDREGENPPAGGVLPDRATGPSGPDSPKHPFYSPLRRPTSPKPSGPSSSEVGQRPPFNPDEGDRI